MQRHAARAGVGRKAARGADNVEPLAGVREKQQVPYRSAAALFERGLGPKVDAGAAVCAELLPRCHLHGHRVLDVDSPRVPRVLGQLEQHVQDVRTQNRETEHIVEEARPWRSTPRRARQRRQRNNVDQRAEAPQPGRHADCAREADANVDERPARAAVV
eukprot:Amastigsp_a845057_11.p6 type:complete len:160 gc:universal Amastigsp_a845057_11:1465-986(-)